MIKHTNNLKITSNEKKHRVTIGIVYFTEPGSTPRPQTQKYTEHTEHTPPTPSDTFSDHFPF